jgi:predicted TIM-barrel fold metal-dependent hydrolase
MMQTHHQLAARARRDLPVAWLVAASQRRTDARLRYSGPLAADGVRLSVHLGYDGWQQPVQDVSMQRQADGSWVATLPEAAGHHVVDFVVQDEAGDRSDNNDGANYRLWLELDPVDSHVHARSSGMEEMGFRSLQIALASGGVTHAVVSWQDNRFVDRVATDKPWLSKLVWVRPGRTRVEGVRRRLKDGAVGLKLHPAYDNFQADTPRLDPYLEAAAAAEVPVTVHSSFGPSDPDLIRSLAERFPAVPVVLYHTYLGPGDGRRRASRHAQEVPNLYLETSWCRSAEVEQLVDEVGADRVLFGSDAAVDGPYHFVRNPPNIEMVENYNQGLLTLAQRLDADVLRAVLQDNTRRLFRLPEPQFPQDSSAKAPPQSSPDDAATGVTADATGQRGQSRSQPSSRDSRRPGPRLRRGTSG